MSPEDLFWVRWSGAFVITLAVEVSLCLQLLTRIHWRRVLVAAVLCSSLTHPLLWWAYLHSQMDYWSFVAVGECVVVLVETGVLFALLPLDWTRALGMSLTMNSASFLVGLVVL